MCATVRIPIVLSALAGILAAGITGAGEYLLHYDAHNRFSAPGYGYLIGIPVDRASVGHFLCVFGVTLYPLGCYHIYQMLKPANNGAAFSAFLVGTFGFIVGAVWFGSRASIIVLVQVSATPESDLLINLYKARYETLLQVMRMCVLILSGIVMWLSLTGRSHYPKWMALLSPILLMLLNYVVSGLAPGIGLHTAPIALNLAFGVFFIMSLFFALRMVRSGYD